MGTSKLLLTVLQLSPILAQLNVHCITNEDEFNAEGWSSAAKFTFAETEGDLPPVFQNQMTAADGIFVLTVDGSDPFIIINSLSPLNLQPPVNMYIRYYGHVPVIASQVLIVFPALDTNTRDLNLKSDFTWQNESIKIDEVVANTGGIEIWFQNAEVGDFLLIDSMIITEGAIISEEEMIAKCSQSTSPPPSSTSTVEFPSSSGSVSTTSTPATGLSSTSSTTESSSASSISQSIPSSTAPSSTLAQFNFHCITNKNEFTAEGWSSSPPVEFAETEGDLPPNFQGHMTAADGIFYLQGDDQTPLMIIYNHISQNLRPPVNMYIRYYAHVPVISDPKQVALVYPDPDSSGFKKLKLESDFVWRNESMKIDEVIANIDQIAIYFQNAQVGDFLLIDSMIITEEATLSEEEMIALCSPPTSTLPSSTSTVEFPSSSGNVSPTSTPVTGLSSTSSTTEFSSASSISQSKTSSITELLSNPQ